MHSESAAVHPSCWSCANMYVAQRDWEKASVWLGNRGMITAYNTIPFNAPPRIKFFFGVGGFLSINLCVMRDYMILRL